MAKSAKPKLTASMPSAPSELIVVVNPNAGIRAETESVASVTGSDVSSLNTLLNQYGATLHPVFGSENRVSRMAAPTLEAMEEARINVSTFYKVDANETANLQELATALLNEGVVEAAYVKPPAEPPVMLDQMDAAPDGGEAPPATPDFRTRQLYLDPAPGGIDARYAWTLSGGKGNGTRIIDIEGAWRFTHEDLINNQGGVIGGTQSADMVWINHGTAVVGVFGGDENAFGITGICPNANTRAISIFGPGMGSSVAIRQAADALSAGDIMLLELHRPGPRFNFTSPSGQAGFIAIEWWPDDFAAILYARSRGVIVVEAAGNGSENLNDALYNTRPAGFPASWRNPFNMGNPQSGAIVVGAGAPPPGTHGQNHGPDRSRLGFSNHGLRVDVQGWGREVTTAGYGVLQGGANQDIWYTDTFSGTSSASPIVVGALGCIQGRLRSRSQPLLTPATAVNLLRTTGSPQQAGPGAPVSQRIGNRPNLRQALTNLGVGKAVVKEMIKEGKEFVKDGMKDIIKDGIKDGIKDKEFVKEGGKDKIEIKEFKDKEIKEFKEVKEFEKQLEKQILEKVKDIREGIDIIRPDDRILQQNQLIQQGQLLQQQGGGQPTNADPGSTDDRLGRLEQMMGELMHFISPQNRPDVAGAMFAQDPATQQLQEQLQKNASDAKQMKDSKDLEKTREL
ncbi:MAG: S8 family serine peptidase [Rudanella sp.]|nr:S8 family serine peptidase [Rudanella sp.]